MEFFYDATFIAIGDGRISIFWHTPWLNGCKPKDIVSSIFAISTRKNFTVNKCLNNDLWVSKINIFGGICTQHIVEFVELWTRIGEVHLVDGMPDDITWKFTNSGV